MITTEKKNRNKPSKTRAKLCSRRLITFSSTLRVLNFSTLPGQTLDKLRHSKMSSKMRFSLEELCKMQGFTFHLLNPYKSSAEFLKSSSH